MEQHDGWTLAIRVRSDERRELDRTLDGAALRYAATADDDPSGRARERFLIDAVPFADRVASRYRGRGVPFDDLRQVARLGLIKAVDNLHPERGSFTAYAVATMRGELRRHFRDTGWDVHVTRAMQELTLDVWRAVDDLTGELMHPPTRDELSARLSVAPADLDQALRAADAWDALSLDAPASGPRDSIDESAQLAELLGTPDTQLDSVEDRLTMRELIGKLPAREQKILALKFYGNVSQAGIAKATGVSQMHVSRLLSRALCWLREAMLSDITPPWPGLDGQQDAVDLVVGVRHDNGTVTVSIRGEIDRDTSNSLRRQLEFYCRRAHTGVRVDLRQAPFIDNAGLSGIAACYRVAHGRHIEFGLTHANPTVVRGMQIAGLAHLVNA